VEFLRFLDVFAALFQGFVIGKIPELMKSAMALPQSRDGAFGFAGGRVGKGLWRSSLVPIQGIEKTFADAATREPQMRHRALGQGHGTFFINSGIFPDDKTLKEGRKDIEKAQKLHAANPREQGSSTPPPLSIRKIQDDACRAYARLTPQLLNISTAPFR